MSSRWSHLCTQTVSHGKLSVGVWSLLSLPLFHVSCIDRNNNRSTLGGFWQARRTLTGTHGATHAHTPHSCEMGRPSGTDLSLDPPFGVLSLTWWSVAIKFQGHYNPFISDWKWVSERHATGEFQSAETRVMSERDKSWSTSNDVDFGVKSTNKLWVFYFLLKLHESRNQRVALLVGIEFVLWRKILFLEAH